MLTTVGLWVAIVFCGINLGLALCFIPPVGRKWDWFPVWWVGGGMLAAGVVLSLLLGGYRC